MTIRESQIEAYLVHQIKGIGAICWKFVSPGVTGVPDRIVLFRGRAYFVEVKAETGQLKKIQYHRSRQIRECGLSVDVVKNKDEIDQLIERIRNAVPAA